MSEIQGNTYLYCNDVDPDPVASTFIWVRGFGSGSRGIRYILDIRKKQSLTNKFWDFFLQEMIFFQSKTKDIGTDLTFFS